MYYRVIFLVFKKLYGGEIKSMSITSASESRVKYSDVKFKKRGGMSLIYEARDQKLGRKVLFKIMSGKTGDEEEKKIKEKLFFREAKILSRLHHDNIVRYYDMVNTNKNMAICMEYVEGVDLHQLRQKQKISEEEVVEYSIQILDALEYLHSRCIVYRDLKPENIMLDTSNNIRLIDFGLSTFYYDKEDDYLYGTAAYAPIEQYRGRVDYRSDIYSLGFTMNYLITGINPNVFTLVEMENIGLCLQFVIERAASRDVMDRYQSAAQMRADLLAYKNRKKYNI